MHSYTELAAVVYCPPDRTQLSGAADDGSGSEQSQGPATHLAGGSACELCEARIVHTEGHTGKFETEACGQQDTLTFGGLMRQDLEGAWPLTMGAYSSHKTAFLFLFEQNNNKRPTATKTP